MVFPTLTVRENLIATAANRAGRFPAWTQDRIYQLFPCLGERARQYAGTCPAASSRCWRSAGR